MKNELDSSFFNQQFVPERHKLLLCQMRNRIRGFLIDPSRKRSGMEKNRKNMVVLVMGGSGSGKSAWAEECIVRLARGRRLYYLATMQVFDQEGREKVRRHQALRRDKGFLTVEQPVSVHEALERVKGEAVLLECVSNLAANEMFSGESPLSAVEVSQKVVSGIEKLKEGLKDLVIVTNNVFEDGIAYDETTAEYIRALGEINARLARLADWVVEVVAGIPLMIKGERRAGKESGQLTGQEDVCIF